MPSDGLSAATTSVIARATIAASRDAAFALSGPPLIGGTSTIRAELLQRATTVMVPFMPIG